MTTKIHNKSTKGNKTTMKRHKMATKRHTATTERHKMTFQRDKITTWRHKTTTKRQKRSTDAYDYKEWGCSIWSRLHVCLMYMGGQWNQPCLPLSQLCALAVYVPLRFHLWLGRCTGELHLQSKHDCLSSGVMCLAVEICSLCWGCDGTSTLNHRWPFSMFVMAHTADLGPLHNWKIPLELENLKYAKMLDLLWPRCFEGSLLFFFFLQYKPKRIVKQ